MNSFTQEQLDAVLTERLSRQEAAHKETLNKLQSELDNHNRREAIRTAASSVGQWQSDEAILALGDQAAVKTESGWVARDEFGQFIPLSRYFEGIAETHSYLKRSDTGASTPTDRTELSKMSAKEKAAFIEQHGYEAFEQRVMKGRRS